MDKVRQDIAGNQREIKRSEVRQFFNNSGDTVLHFTHPCKENEEDGGLA